MPRTVGKGEQHERIADEARVGTRCAHDSDSTAARARFEQRENNEGCGDGKKRPCGEDGHICDVENIAGIARGYGQKEQRWQCYVEHETSEKAHIRWLEEPTAHAKITEQHCREEGKRDAEDGDHISLSYRGFRRQHRQLGHGAARYGQGSHRPSWPRPRAQRGYLRRDRGGLL